MNLFTELIEGMLSGASETALSIFGVIVLGTSIIWASVAVILVTRWMLGLEFKVIIFRLGTHFTGALIIIWAGATAFISLNSYALTMREDHLAHDFDLGFAALWLNFVIGAVTLIALLLQFNTSITVAARRARDTDRNVAAGGSA